MGETISQTTPVARKPHFCAYCNAAIPKGEKHCAWTWADEGRLSSLHAHERCAKMANRIFRHEGGRFDPNEWREFRDECDFLYPNEVFPWQGEPCAPAATPA